MLRNCTNISSNLQNETCGDLALRAAGDEVTAVVLGVVLTVMLGLVVFSLGCTVEPKKVLTHLTRPCGVVLGLVCQFGLMPLTASILAVTFSVKPAQAVAVLIMGCCPGGILSNIISYWIDGDMDLSLTMTTCSTILAMGMMPLCLFVYSRSWEISHSIKIPYANIGITLLSLVAPMVGGMFVNYKWPKKAKLISKVGSVIGGLLMLVIGVASAVLYKGSWNMDLSIVIIGMIYPLIGYISGFAMAIVVRQPWRRCRTIALETGAQNVQMCSTVLQLSFSPEQLVQMFAFPLIYGSFQLLNGLLLVAALKKLFGSLPYDEKRVGLEYWVFGLLGLKLLKTFLNKSPDWIKY
ncbi:sodium-dependent organic anion transporter isoform X2 [Pleurodeles waltl]|uniref:sodium-dependent organic anion transporter isoform X2 n=1 Tax=Pleurodeles waltl TaxID=8319 RepID=UPI0037095D5C